LITDSLVKVAYPVLRTWPFYAKPSALNCAAKLLSQGVNIKWLAEYCGTSVAMIEKHYGRYVKSDSREQLERLFGAKTETFSETLRNGTDDEVDEVVEKEDGK